MKKRKGQIMKLIQLKTMVFAAILAIPILFSSQAIADEELFPYLRCNATGWDVNDATKLVPTDDPDIYVLEYSVTEEWMVSGFDQCILTITNSPDGWGTFQQFIGTASTVPIDVPGTWALDETSGTYAQVSYPELGDYHATVDFLEMTVTFEPADTTPPPADDVYYYLRCNTTGWNVGSNNRLVLDESNGLYTLDYSVTKPWIVAWGDMCILTQTNEEDGWGSNQVQWGIVPGSGKIVIPEDGEDSATMVDGGQYFGVSYPTMGDYFAEFDPATGELTLGVPGDEIPDYGLHGVVEDIGDGRVRITYDFETEDQVEDWLPVDSEETGVAIVDGRLEISGYMADGMALFIRNLRVDSLLYEVEWLNGSHVSIYLGVEWDYTWRPEIGYGLIHYYSGRLAIDNYATIPLGGAPLVQDHIYQGDILAETDGITWALDDEIISVPLSYSNDVTRSLAIGAYSSRAAFDNIVIEGELAPLP